MVERLFGYDAASKIESYLPPLAAVLPPVESPPDIPTDKEIVDLFKDAWYNLCCHGFAFDSPLTKKNYRHLLRIAHSTPPLASESSWNRSETSIDLNTVLRRGTSKHTEKLHKDTLKTILNSKSFDTKFFETQVSKPKIIFLAAGLLVETLRVDSGDCSLCLDYLSDPSIVISGLQNYCGSIAYFCASKYVAHVQKGEIQFCNLLHSNLLT
ncbi:unnamed protein product [Ambrosiozyma monospora]|uniref:Unnamed protein product n=1 Tax=Ambrosiozyma monospora TaxID=43982 RepID=A0ACB5U2P9_AMBMO|nr:unnamed protein product [Ambrosiozyma monospora]